MKKNIPLVSILLLSYNHEEFIEDSIKSVFALTSIDYDVELRIIDDGSTDKTQDIINNLHSNSSIPMYVKFKKHAGITAISKNFNELIFDAKGEYITFLASDDLLLKEDFFTRLDLLRNNNNLQLIYSNGIDVENGVMTKEVITNDMLRILESNDAKEVYKYLISTVPTLYIQALIVRRAFLRNVGGFDEDLIADDWVLNIKMFKYLYESSGHYYFINKIAFLRNIHSSNTSSNSSDQLRRILQVVNKYFEEKNKKSFMSSLFWQYGKIYIKDYKIFKGIVLLTKSQMYSFDLIRKVSNAIVKIKND